MSDDLYAAMLAELLPAARRLAHDDQLNEELGVERWGDLEIAANVHLPCGLLRRVLAAHASASPEPGREVTG